MENERFRPLISSDSLDNWQLKKQKRMYEIAKILEVRKKVGLNHFVAELCIKCGLDGKTARKYINSFKDFGLITIDNQEIIWIEADNEGSLC